MTPAQQTRDEMLAGAQAASGKYINVNRQQLIDALTAAKEDPARDTRPDDHPDV